MADQIVSQRILCKGGLNTSENFLLLSEAAPGAATTLVNYETALSGGYRRIDGYTWLDDTYKEVTNVTDVGEGRVLGVWGFLNSVTGNFEIYAARKKTGSATYKFYLYNAITGWGTVVTGTTQSATGVTRVRAETFTTVLGNSIAFVDGVNKALVFDGLTWYQLSSGNAGGAGSPGGNQVLDAPAVVTFFKDTLFLSADPNYDGVVAYSAPGDVVTWTAAAGAGQLLVGYPVQQIKAFRDECFIFGLSAIKKAIPDVALGFYLQSVTNNLGCLARDSVVELGGSLLFFGPDGIRPVSGTDRIGDVELNLLSQNIQNSIKEIVDAYPMDDVVSVVIRSKAQFRYFISDSTVATADAIGLIGCTRVYSEGPSWEYGELRGIQANTSWSGYNDLGAEIVLHGDYDGFVFQQEIGSSFAGSDITSIYTTPYLDLGDTEIRKLFRNLNVFIRAEGSLTFSLGVHYDWARTTVLNPTDYTSVTIAGPITFDDGFLFDAGHDFGSSSQPVFNINIQGSGFAVAFTILTTGTFSSHTVQGLVLEYSPKGRD